MSWGNAIAAGIQAVGIRRGTNKANRHNIKMRQMAQEQFDAQMDETVQRRVKDAQAAGIHPLFALGASSGASPTISATNTAAAGGGGSAATGIIASVMDAILDRTRSETKSNEADAQLKDANRAAIENMFGSRWRDKLGASNAPNGFPEHTTAKTPAPGKTETLTSQATSHKPGDPSTEASVKTPYVEYRRRDGSLGNAFGADVPGAEELNAFWIPIQNWWHTSKEARRKLRNTLGITSDPVHLTKAEIQKIQRQRAKVRKVLNDLHRSMSGPPTR